MASIFFIFNTDLLSNLFLKLIIFSTEFFDKGLNVFGSLLHKNKIHSISISNLIFINADSLKFSLKLDILFAYLLSSGEILL